MEAINKLKCILLTGCIFMFSPIVAQIGSDEAPILKSEMVKSSLGEWTDNIADHVTLTTEQFIPHSPVLISTDSKSKFLKLEFSNPDKDRITLVISDSLNNIVSVKHFKCKRYVKIGMQKVNCDEFRVNIYHNQEGVIMASQQFRKNVH